MNEQSTALKRRSDMPFPRDRKTYFDLVQAFAELTQEVHSQPEAPTTEVAQPKWGTLLNKDDFRQVYLEVLFWVGWNEAWSQPRTSSSPKRYSVSGSTRIFPTSTQARRSSIGSFM